MININLHIYPSPLTHESRMLKETKSMADADIADRIYLIGMWEDDLKEHEQIDDKRQIWRIKPRLGTQESSLIIKALRYLEWQLRILWRFRTGSVKLVNCHSLPVLPLGMLFKLLKKSTVVYDAHELETEVVGLAGARRLLFKLVERGFIKYVNAVITVNDSITEWYKRRYGLQNVTTVRNIPYRHLGETGQQANILKREFAIGKNDILYIFQGLFGPGRGIGIMLDVFSRLDRHKHIVFMGYGEWEAPIKEYEQTYPNIHFQEAVRPSEVGRYTCCADVGICLLENLCLSFYLSLPNKLFEYISSGLPLIVSDFPEMKRVIDETGCGWKVAVDKSALYSLVTRISKDEIAAKRHKAIQYSKMIGWQNEEKALLNVYRHMLACEK